MRRVYKIDGERAKKGPEIPGQDRRASRHIWIRARSARAIIGLRQEVLRHEPDDLGESACSLIEDLTD